jgi:hypothetical protein
VAWLGLNCVGDCTQKRNGVCVSAHACGLNERLVRNHRQRQRLPLEFSFIHRRPPLLATRQRTRGRSTSRTLVTSDLGVSMVGCADINRGGVQHERGNQRHPEYRQQRQRHRDQVATSTTTSKRLRQRRAPNWPAPLHDHADLVAMPTFVQPGQQPRNHSITARPSNKILASDSRWLGWRAWGATHAHAYKHTHRQTHTHVRPHARTHTRARGHTRTRTDTHTHGQTHTQDRGCL